jgi:methoxymalonate biosynthesis acyl carrier protein
MQIEEIPTAIRSFLSSSFQGRQLADDDDIFDQGFGNSLFAMQLVAFVENQFRIEIDSDDLDMKNFRTVRTIAGLVERKLAPAVGT